MIKRHPSIEPVHPGEILHEDFLLTISMSKTAIADTLGISPLPSVRATHP